MLRDNYEQNVLLGMARKLSPALVIGAPAVHAAAGEGRRAGPRAGVPAVGQGDRRSARPTGIGLVSPENAVLVAYVEDHADRAASRTRRCRTSRGSSGCSPATSRRRSPSGSPTSCASHPLHREIITTVVVNDMINRGGTTFVHRAIEETGADVAADHPGVQRGARGVRPAGSCGPRSRRWTTRCRPTPSTPATRRSAG